MLAIASVRDGRRTKLSMQKIFVTEITFYFTAKFLLSDSSHMIRKCKEAVDMEQS